MTHGRHAPGRVIAGVIVPGNDIHLLRPFEIIKPFKRPHQIGCNRGLFIVSSDRRLFHLEILQQAVRIKPPVINGNPRKCRSLFPDSLAERIRQYNLVPVIDRVPPERQIPRLIERLYRLIFLSEPDTECLLTILAVALPAIFVVHMPAHHILAIPVPLSQPSGNLRDKMPVHKTVGTGVMPLPEFVAPTLIVRSRNLGITLHHPSGKRSRRSGQNNLFPFPGQHIHNLIQLTEIIDLLRRLNPCP